MSGMIKAEPEFVREKIIDFRHVHLQDIGCQNQERAAVEEGKEQLKSRLGKKVAGAVDDDWQQAPAPPDLSLTPVCLCLLAGQTQWLFPSETATSPLRERILFLCFCLFCCHPWPWLWLDYGSSLSSSWSLALTEPGRICIPAVIVMQITILKKFLLDLQNTWTPLFRTLSRLHELYIREHNAFANANLQICAIDLITTFCCFLFVTPFRYLPDQLFLLCYIDIKLQNISCPTVKKRVLIHLSGQWSPSYICIMILQWCPHRTCA